MFDCNAVTRAHSFETPISEFGDVVFKNHCSYNSCIVAAFDTSLDWYKSEYPAYGAMRVVSERPGINLQFLLPSSLCLCMCLYEVLVHHDLDLNYLMVVLTYIGNIDRM